MAGLGHPRPEAHPGVSHPRAHHPPARCSPADKAICRLCFGRGETSDFWGSGCVSYKVGIAGGGLAGLTLAVALHQRGHGVIVFERQSEVRDAGAGILLWPNALAALDSIGLGELVRALGPALATGGQRKVNGRVGLTFTRPRFEAALGEGLVCVDRGKLVRSLADLLPAGVIRADCPVVGYERAGSAVTVRVASGAKFPVDALVGADGINSTVAAQMSGALKSAYSRYTAWRAIAEIGAPHEDDHLWACLAGGHEFGWMPVGPNRTYWFATAWVPEGHSFPDGDAAYLKATFGHWPSPIGDLLGATQGDQLVRNDIVDRAVPRRWSDGPVTLMGDAAHPMRPHLGQGGCQAIEDAAALTHSLDHSVDPAGAFRAYERRRRRRARLIVGLSRYSGFTRPPGVNSRAFDRVANALPQIPLGPALRMLAPVAGYRAGQRAVS